MCPRACQESKQDRSNVIMAHCKDVENFQRILECPICLERMKDPRCLPCLHSFCEKCIGQHMDEKQTNGSFPCPMCKLKFQVPKDGVMGFKRNLYLLQISELFPEVAEVQCDFCKLQGAEKPATSICFHCRDHLCQGCADIHCLTKVTVGHKVVNLEEIRNGQNFEEIRRLQKVYCPKHAEKCLEVYCENCVKPVCLLCAVLEHKQHEMRNLEEAAAEAHEVMRGLLDSWKLASEHSTILSAERKKTLDGLEQEEERLIGEMKQLYKTFKDRIVEEIDLKMNDSIADLKTEIAKARKQAEVAYNEAEFSRITITNTLNYCQEILSSPQDAEKLQQFQDIKTRLESLDIRKLETDVMKPVFKLQKDPLTMIPDLAMKTVTELVKEPVTSCVSEQTRQPHVYEKATLKRNLNVKIRGEINSSSDGVAVHGDRLIVTDRHSHKVKAFDRSSGNFRIELDSGQHKLLSPCGVACNSMGDIFVTYDSIKGVVRYNSEGQVLKVTPNLCTSLGGITCYRDQLVVADLDGGRVLIADFDCIIRKVINKESLGLNAFNPIYVCVDNDGHLVVSDNSQGRVHVIDHKQPTIIKTFSDQLCRGVHGVCVDEWGHILVSDSIRVLMMSGQLEHARVLITRDDVNYPTDLAVTGPGEVAVLECNTGYVKVFKYADV